MQISDAQHEMTGGLTLGLWVEAPFATGAWLTAAVLFVFALAGRRLVLGEERTPAS